MTRTEDIGTRLRLAFCDARDGPRVVFFGPIDADFGSLQSSFFWLSNHPGESLAVHDLPYVVAFGGLALVARSCSARLTGKAEVQGIRRIRTNDPPHYVWTRTAEGWDYLAELIGGLVLAERDCHQYLTRYPGEDAIVIVSKGEYDDDVLKR